MLLESCDTRESMCSRTLSSSSSSPKVAILRGSCRLCSLDLLWYGCLNSRSRKDLPSARQGCAVAAMANWCCVEYEAALVCCEVEESWGFKKVERDDERE